MMSMPIDNRPIPPGGEPAKEAKSDVLGNVADAMEVGGLLVDATVVAVQVGSFAVEAGATTLNVVATGADVVGSILGGLGDL